ncbi:helix-turn-helix domain-containing protein [Lederbergia lenta]|uniref:helix-turn-helix domain-containing protein n=1 Tax=Lederbergia lenta TaxID=1467 RepID=UPI00203E652D|nr:helix-turn-helix transcriptional regulator [Lederbergia lenta]MCM3110641.1 helix-turn-helix domain-containing protein [Lederbergia lenta]
MLIHEKIKAIRNFKGIKQKPLADALNLTVQAYSFKERGKRPITTTELELIAKQLQVPTSIFFEDNFNVKFNDFFPKQAI